MAGLNSCATGFNASSVMPLKRSLKSGVWPYGPLEVAWFAEETAAVERAVDSLTTRLEKLEAK